MSDTTTEPATTTGEPQNDATPEGATPNDVAETLGEGGKRALQAEREARKAAESRLAELERAQMSDLERAQAEARTAQEAAQAAQSEALRWRIAAKHGISDEDAETFLTGTDEESLTRQAGRLAALSTPAGPTTPKPDRTQGGSGAPAPATPEDEFASFLKNQMG